MCHSLFHPAQLRLTFSAGNAARIINICSRANVNRSLLHMTYSLYLRGYIMLRCIHHIILFVRV